MNAEKMATLEALANQVNESSIYSDTIGGKNLGLCKDYAEAITYDLENLRSLVEVIGESAAYGTCDGECMHRSLVLIQEKIKDIEHTANKVLDMLHNR